MKIYDCFIFYNEIELLKFRIEYLKDIVDYFIIVEADQTHTGINKPQNFSFNFFEDSIISKIRYEYISFPKNLPYPQYVSDINDPKNIDAWKKENYQRERLINNLFDANDEDIILVTDLDEIPKKETLLKIKNLNKEILENNDIFALQMDHFNFDIKGYCSWPNKDEFKWMHPKFTIKKNLKSTNLIRLSMPNMAVADGGWHFSYFGGSDRIKNKIKSMAHTEVANENILNKVDENRKNKIDPLGNVIFTDSYSKKDLPSLIFSPEFINFFEGNLG